MAAPAPSPSSARLSRAVLASGGALGLVALTAPAAGAVTVPAGTYVVDEAGVLSPAQEQQLTSEIRSLRSETGRNLYVVYVDRFATDGQALIDDVVRQRDLGSQDSVLAIEVEERSFRFDTAMADSLQSGIISSYISPQIGDGDWLVPAEAALHGVDDAANGTIDGRGASGTTYDVPAALPGDAGGDAPAATSDEGSGSGVLTGVLGAGALAAVVGGGALALRSRRRKAAAEGGSGTGTAAAPRAPRDPLDDLSVAELRTRAGQKLVAADDAIRSSEQELGFALASYGEDAVKTFGEDIAKAKDHMRASFQLQHQLDDEIPDTEADQRAWLKEIIARCDQVDASLQAHQQEFNQLRDLENSVPDALSRLEARVPAAERSVQDAEKSLVALHGAYAESALTEVNDNATQARERLEFVRTAEAKARSAWDGGDRSTAALAVRAAEESLGQVDTLTAAVAKAGTVLETLMGNVRTGIAQSEQDVAEAEGVLAAGRSPELAGPVAGMRQTLANVRAGLQSGRPDPRDLLAQLESAHRQLNVPLSGVRDAREQARQAEQMLSAAIAQAQAQIDGTADFIGVRRGAVGSEARTRLAEADRALQTAISLRSSDPVAALDHAQRAGQLATRASELAQQDVSEFGYGGGLMGGGYGGGLGYGRAYGRGYGSGLGGSFAGGLGGALLGGILMNSMFDGDGDSWGGGGFGGYGGGLGGGDFGGFGDGGGGDFGGFGDSGGGGF